MLSAYFLEKNAYIKKVDFYDRVESHFDNYSNSFIDLLYEFYLVIWSNFGWSF
jgi:hypothetical protein